VGVCVCVCVYAFRYPKRSYSCNFYVCTTYKYIHTYIHIIHTHAYIHIYTHTCAGGDRVAFDQLPPQSLGRQMQGILMLASSVYVQVADAAHSTSMPRGCHGVSFQSLVHTYGCAGFRASGFRDGLFLHTGYRDVSSAFSRLSILTWYSCVFSFVFRTLARYMYHIFVGCPNIRVSRVLASGGWVFLTDLCWHCARALPS
jgi:hypothetical protein